jgi:integrase
MSNKIYDDSFYNEEKKEWFLKDLPRNTYQRYSRVLSRAKYLEEQLGKDLYNFNIKEIEQLLHYLNPKTINSCQGSTSIILSYIRWAIEQDLRKDNLNPLDALIGYDFYNKFIDTTSQVIFSFEEIQDIIGGRINAQDYAVVQALFEGLFGKKYSELLNLSKNDIDEENLILTLKEDVSEYETRERKVKVSPLLIKMLIKASEQKIYHKSNGEGAAILRAPTSDLMENNYVFRPSNLNTKGNGKADPHLVLRRLKLMSIENSQPYLSAINIRNSGMLYMAYQLYVETGNLTKKEIDIICEHFNIPILKNGTGYNAHRLREQFLNVDTLKEIYEI